MAFRTHLKHVPEHVLSERTFRFWIKKFVRYCDYFTDLSRLPNRLNLIVAGPVHGGISLYDLLNKIKRESMMKIQSFIEQVILLITAF